MNKQETSNHSSNLINNNLADDLNTVEIRSSHNDRIEHPNPGDPSLQTTAKYTKFKKRFFLYFFQQNC